MSKEYVIAFDTLIVTESGDELWLASEEIFGTPTSHEYKSTLSTIKAMESDQVARRVREIERESMPIWQL